ncbi:MAG: hypothetical protein WBE76_13175, partial [Terracidiphilus sp.]
SRLPIAEGDEGQRLQDAASVIKSARAELREIAGLLASPEPAPSRRRARMAPVQTNTESLFPS